MFSDSILNIEKFHIPGIYWYHLIPVRNGTKTEASPNSVAEPTLLSGYGIFVSADGSGSALIDAALENTKSRRLLFLTFLFLTGTYLI